MDCEKIGAMIYKLRKEKAMTQKQLADLMNISDKTISKWERGLGCPDISLLSELAKILDANIDELLAGKLTQNEMVGGNMKKLKFYVCPQCHNLITATGDATISCCSKKLTELLATPITSEHALTVEPVEDELYITSPHAMQKEHYISFVAYITGDKAFIAKQYPEWNLSLRFHKLGHGQLFFYCSNHGLFSQRI